MFARRRRDSLRECAVESVKSLICDLEYSLSHESSEQRVAVLHRVTDLFLERADDYSEEQVGIFDGVVMHLIEKIEHQALIELSGKLAPASAAPINVVQHLSRHEDIAVAGPVLEKSTVLSEGFLVQVARAKGQEHLAAIAGRAHLGVALTDVLVDRGNLDVARKVTDNPGAQFSTSGMNTIMNRATGDHQLAMSLAHRDDVPPEILGELFRKATKVVKHRLLATADATVRERVNQILELAAQKVARTESPSSLHRAGGVTQIPIRDTERLKSRLISYAQGKQSAETIETLALLCEVPTDCVKGLVRKGSDDGFVILAKAAGLGWPDLQLILQTTLPKSIEDHATAKVLFNTYLSLSVENAKRALRFIKTTKAASNADIDRILCSR